MKSLIASSVLLLILIVLIICNSLYINNVANELLQRVDALGADPLTAAPNAARILSDWQSVSVFVALSANHNLVDRIEEQARVLSATAAVGDLHGYITARALFSDALEDLLRPESLRGVM